MSQTTIQLEIDFECLWSVNRRDGTAYTGPSNSHTIWTFYYTAIIVLPFQQESYLMKREIKRIQSVKFHRNVTKILKNISDQRGF